MRVVAIDKPLLKIGRAEDNDMVLLDTQRSVSRRHATISNQTSGAATLADLNSVNGTLLNGRRILGSMPLTHNDCIAVGNFRLIFKEESSESSFMIRASDVDLQRLQQEPKLLGFAGPKEAATTTELRSLELLYEVGMTLARSQSAEEVTAAAVQMLFKIEEVHRATVMLWREERSSFDEAELYFRGGERVSTASAVYDPRSLVLSRTILNKVRQENRPLLIRDDKEDTVGSAASIVRAGIQAAFCSPLSCQGRFLGVLYADNLAQPDAFSDTDFRTFTAIAAQTGLALGNAMASKELLRREVQRQALKAYLPPQVADLILSSDGAIDLSGTLQDITVLFADIRGFTRISERMDAREVVQMLNELFTVMTDVIFRCEGTVDKFIGDCIMALFGAPLASAHSADDALKAAIEMQRAAMCMNTSRIELGLKELHLGIGLHTGSAVVGNIGSAERVQYTAIGDTVNVASRLVSRAAPDQIIVSESFKEALSATERLQLMGETELKGRQTKLNIYSVEWSTEVLAPFGAEPSKTHG